MAVYMHPWEIKIKTTQKGLRRQHQMFLSNLNQLLGFLKYFKLLLGLSFASKKGSFKATIWSNALQPGCRVLLQGCAHQWGHSVTDSTGSTNSPTSRPSPAQPLSFCGFGKHKGQLCQPGSSCHCGGFVGRISICGRGVVSRWVKTLQLWVPVWQLQSRLQLFSREGRVDHADGSGRFR